MRIFAPSAAVLAASFSAVSPSAADDFPTAAPVTAATVYVSGGAMVARTASLALPSGSHRILIPVGSSALETTPTLHLSEGATVTQSSVIAAAELDPTLFYTEVQKAAFTRIETLENQLSLEQDQMRIAEAEIAGLEAKIGFIAALKAPRENADLALIETLSTHVSHATQQAQAQISTLRAEARDAQKRLEDLGEEHARAKAAFARLTPPLPSGYALAISVEVAQEATLDLVLESIEEAGWAPTYEIDLATGAEAQISLKRDVLVEQYSSLPWADVALTLSTSNLQQALSPSYVESGEASYWAKGKHMISSAAAPVAEMMVMEDASFKGNAMNDGVAVRYEFEQPVSLLSDDRVQLHLDQLTFAAEQSWRAVPHADSTAFFVGHFTNTSGEPIVTGRARISRDGVPVGEQFLPQIVANSEAELGFGPLESLQIEQIYIENETGDKGVIQRSNRRTQEMILRLSNLSSEPREVRTYYGLPFSAQEDLEVRINANPEPSETNVEDRQGISIWDVSLAPQEVKDITLSIDMSWPTGSTLNWQP
jgi:uncharacterized protein (TIGR02231 family)